MNILWIIGQICAALLMVSLFLYLTDKNEKRERIWMGISICLIISYITLYIVRMAQIINILQNGN